MPRAISTVNGVQANCTGPQAPRPPSAPSWLSWNSSRGWGITGARTRLDFTVHDRDFRLLQPARLPFFDGALRINTLRGPEQSAAGHGRRFRCA